MNYRATVFWNNFWELIYKKSEGMTGLEVLKIMKEVSDEVYESGIDAVYDKSLKQDPTSVEPVNFDITWLTLLAVRLTK